MRRIARWAGGLLGSLLALAVVIHLPPVRHWLAANGHHGAGVCPLGYTAKPHGARTSPDATARPALAFALGRTRTSDIARWAISHGIACRDRHGGTSIECLGVPAAALGLASSLPATGLWLTLDADGTLASIQVARRTTSATSVAAAFARLDAGLTEVLGAPSQRAGGADATTLAGGSLRQASLEFHAPGYRARVRETNMGDGFVLTEDYARVD